MLGAFERRAVLHLVGAALASSLPVGRARSQGGAPAPFLFFSPAEAAFVASACDRIIPADPPGPGAVEVGCVEFIDGQLAGAFGSGARMYLEGPFHDGRAEQGYQLSYTPAELYRHAIASINDSLRSGEKARAFAELMPEQQDELLARLGDGDGEFGDWGKPFGEMIVRNTIQGYFADPIYGGNRDMAAWRMIGFPGAYAQYVELVDAHDRPFHRPPMSIAQAVHDHQRLRR